MQGFYKSAEPLYRRALEIVEKEWGAHPRLILPLNNLAWLYMQQRRYHDSEPLLRKAIEIAEETQETGRTVTAAYENLLSVLKMLGKDDDIAKPKQELKK